MSRPTSIVRALLVLSAATCANPAIPRTDDHTRDAGRREAGRTIVGVARDERGNPVHVKLAIDSDNRNPSFKWSSDAAGSFRISDVPLNAKDLDLIYQEDGGEIGSYPLPTGSAPMSLVIYKHPGIAVTVVDAEGRRLHHIRVTAQRVGSSESPEEIYDPEEGNGTVGLAPGRYMISAPEHPSIVAQTIEVLPFHPIQLALHQRRGATLVVQIADRDGDRSFEEHAYLVKGRTVYPRDDRREKLLLLSAAEPDRVDGSQGVVFGGLDPGVYTVLLPVPDCEENVPLARPVSVTRGANRVSIKLPFVYSECP